MIGQALTKEGQGWCPLKHRSPIMQTLHLVVHEWMNIIVVYLPAKKHTVQNIVLCGLFKVQKHDKRTLEVTRT